MLSKNKRCFFTLTLSFRTRRVARSFSTWNDPYHISSSPFSNNNISPYSSWPSEDTVQESFHLSTQEKLIDRLCKTTVDFVRHGCKRQSNPPLHRTKNLSELELVKKSLDDTLQEVSTTDLSLFSKVEERSVTVSEVSLSKLCHIRGLLELISGNIHESQLLLEEASKLLEKTPYGDDQFVDRVGVLNDCAVNCLMLDDAEYSKNCLKRSQYMAKRAYKVNNSLISLLNINQSELLFLEGKVVEGIKLLKESSMLQVQLKNVRDHGHDHNHAFQTQTQRQKNKELQDIFGVDLSFMIYFNLAKAYLRINSLSAVELYLDVIHQKYFKHRSETGTETTTKNSSTSTNKALIESKYYSLLAIYSLKVASTTSQPVSQDIVQYFLKAESLANNALSFLGDQNLDLLLAKENISLTETSKPSANNALQVSKFENSEEIQLDDGNKIRVVYPSGFFIGGMFDLVAKEAKERKALNSAGGQPIVWK